MVEKDVCVIGGGPAGMAMINSLQKEGVSFSLFEKQNNLGGLWRGGNESALYQDLTTNLPCNFMAFSWKFFPLRSGLFTHHSEVLCYLENLYPSSSLKDVHSSTEVSSIHWDETIAKWEVFTRPSHASQPSSSSSSPLQSSPLQSSSSQHQTRQRHIFRSVVVCNGHYDKINEAHFKGEENFKGEIIHSKYFNDPSLFSDKRVLIVGANVSAADIASLILKKQQPNPKLIVSVRDEESLLTGIRKIIFKNLKREQSGVLFKPNIKHFHPNGHSVVFLNGDQVDHVDVVILGTGYLYSFPFLDRELEDHLLVGRGEKPGMVVQHLYKRIWYGDLPGDETRSALSFVGLPNSLLSPFIVFESQSKCIAKVLAGKLSLPSSEVMSKDARKRDCSLSNGRRDHLGFETSDYCHEIGGLGGGRVPFFERYWPQILCCRLWRIVFDAFWSLSFLRKLFVVLIAFLFIWFFFSFLW